MVKRFARLPYQTTPRLSSVSEPLIAIPIYGDLMHTNGSLRDGSNHFPTRSLTLIFLVSIPTCKAIVCTFLRNVSSHSHLEWHSLVEVDPACRFILSNIYLLQWSLTFHFFCSGFKFSQLEMSGFSFFINDPAYLTLSTQRLSYFCSLKRSNFICQKTRRSSGRWTPLRHL